MEFYYGDTLPYEVSPDAAVSVILTILPLLLMLLIPLIVLSIIGICKVFKKAGRPAGFAFIPIYNYFVQYDIAGCRKLFWFYLPVVIISWLLSNFMPATHGESIAYLAAMLLCMAASLVLGIIWSIKLAKAFGKSSGFAVGLILLSPIFLFILGVDKSRYLGDGGKAAPEKEHMADTWQCSCGAYNLQSSQYCFHCGKRKDAGTPAQ